MPNSTKTFFFIEFNSEATLAQVQNDHKTPKISEVCRIDVDLLGIIQVFLRKKKTLKQEANKNPYPDQNYNSIS